MSYTRTMEAIFRRGQEAGRRSRVSGAKATCPYKADHYRLTWGMGFSFGFREADQATMLKCPKCHCEAFGPHVDDRHKICEWLCSSCGHTEFDRAWTEFEFRLTE